MVVNPGHPWSNGGQPLSVNPGQPWSNSPLHGVCEAAAVAHESVDVHALLLVQEGLKLGQLTVPVMVVFWGAGEEVA